MKRLLGFGWSLAIHVAIIALLLWADATLREQEAAASRYQVRAIPLPVPSKDKIIWYVSHESLPEVRPDRRLDDPTPQGEKDPQNRIIAVESPNAESKRQLIRQPDRPKPLPIDVPAPNLVAVKPTIPLPAATLPPKTFTPPPDTPIRKSASNPVNSLDPPPDLDPRAVQPRNDIGALASASKLPPKAFVPPAARANGQGRTGAGELTAPPEFGADSGPPSSMNAVILGLDSSAVLPPMGSRSGQFSRAPDPGTRLGGGSSPNAATVAGVLSHAQPGGAPPRPAPLPAPLPTRAVKEIAMPGVNRTMSAPLRPSSRVIPATIEAQFANRNVYTLAIPAPAVPGYRRDWVMWFAERPPGGEGQGRILAPIPARKYSSEEVPGQAPPPPFTEQFYAVIDRNGRIGSAKILRGAADEALRRKALEEFATWEFRPALRNGEPIEVDVVLEIPFEFRPAVETRIPGSQF